MNTYSVFIAYLLWFLGGWGVLGLHRFYLGKFGTGFLWLFTLGLFGLGSTYDLFTLWYQVEQKNRMLELLRNASQKPRVTLIQAILMEAKKNRGRVTPNMILENYSFKYDEIQKELDNMVSRKLAALKMTRHNRTLVYYFPEYDPDELSDLEDIT